MIVAIKFKICKTRNGWHYGLAAMFISHHFGVAHRVHYYYNNFSPSDLPDYQNNF